MYQKAIALDPGYYRSHEQLGSFYYYRGKYPEAAEQFQETVDRAPGRFIAFSNLGAALMDMGKFDAAERALMTSLNLRETAPALNNLGAIRAYQGRDAEAIEHYERAVSLDPSDYVNIENAADCYRRVDRLAEAKKAYRKAMTLALTELGENPALGYSRSFVAYCAARLGDTKRAEVEISQALKSSPGDNKVIGNTVLTYEALHQREKAIGVVRGATPQLLHQLCRHPDLADFCQDPRYQLLLNQIGNGGI
jgi:tetratricopeptide (TPR) repeat protein